MATKKHSDLSGFVDNWQGGKTLAQCNLRMLNTQDSCDVTFRCGSEGHVIRAHRYVLISRSCVFHAMFSGPLAEKSDIRVPEIEHQFFQTLILYLYTDNTTIDSDNATALLYVARKYAVTGLENKCRNFLKTNLTVDNACVILEAAHRFDQKELFEEALILIKKEGERSLKSPGFLTLSQELVDQIVESDDLAADEHVVFTTVNSWAEAECKRKGREITPDNKRSVLGDTLMKVRFPLLEHRFLSKEVKSSGLLTDRERIVLFDYLGDPDTDVNPFCTKKRSHCKTSLTSGKPSVISRSRFEDYEFDYYKQSENGEIHAISFLCNKSLSLEGYQLYGPSDRRPHTYQVTSYFGDEDSFRNSTVQEFRIQYKTSYDVTGIQTATTYSVTSEVFDVMFPTPICITAGWWYTLTVIIKGPCSYMGTDGVPVVRCDDGVQFKFRNSNKSKSNTNVSYGQIPSLIYRQESEEVN